MRSPRPQASRRAAAAALPRQRGPLAGRGLPATAGGSDGMLTAFSSPSPQAAAGGPQLSTSQHAQLTKFGAAHRQELSELAKLFSVSRPGVYRVAARQQT